MLTKAEQLIIRANAGHCAFRFNGEWVLLATFDGMD